MCQQQLTQQEARLGGNLARGVAELVGQQGEQAGLALGLAGEQVVERERLYKVVDRRKQRQQGFEVLGVGWGKRVGGTVSQFHL